MTLDQVEMVDEISDVQITAFIAHRRSGKYQVFEPPKQQKKISRSRKTRQKLLNSINNETLADLLDTLESGFDYFKLPSIENIDSLERAQRKALRRIGSYVCKDDMRLDLENSREFYDGEWPALMCMQCMSEKERLSLDQSRFYNAFLFAFKLQSMPRRAASVPGIHYAFGYGMPANSGPEAKNKMTKLIWRCGYLTVDARSMSIVISDEYNPIRKVIPVKNPSDRKFLGKARTITQWKWSHAQIADPDSEIPGDSVERRMQHIKTGFTHLVDRWRARSKQWLVSVYQKGSDARITFSVPPEKTKSYFKDRNRSAIASDGKLKRIIHFVESHTRQIENKQITVKAHIRGLRKFDWKGFSCVVTAPHFHVTTLPSTSFSAGLVSADDPTVGPTVSIDEAMDIIEAIET